MKLIVALLLLFADTPVAQAVVVVNPHLAKAEVVGKRLCFLVSHEATRSELKKSSPTNTTESLACKIGILPALRPERKDVADYPVRKVDALLGYQRTTRICVDFAGSLKRGERILGVGNVTTACLPLSRAKSGFTHWSPRFRPVPAGRRSS